MGGRTRRTAPVTWSPAPPPRCWPQPGAQPVGSDLSVGFWPIARLTDRPMAGDTQALPLRDETFAAVAAAFSRNRVPNP